MKVRYLFPTVRGRSQEIIYVSFCITRSRTECQITEIQEIDTVDLNIDETDRTIAVVGGDAAGLAWLEEHFMLNHFATEFRKHVCTTLERYIEDNGYLLVRHECPKLFDKTSLAT